MTNLLIYLRKLTIEFCKLTIEFQKPTGIFGENRTAIFFIHGSPEFCPWTFFGGRIFLEMLDKVIVQKLDFGFFDIIEWVSKLKNCVETAYAALIFIKDHHKRKQASTIARKFLFFSNEDFP